MGTLLMEHGVPVHQCFEELCLSRPELIREIHEAYVGAGARIIGTNSFGANAVRLARHGLENRVNEINWHAAQLARQAARGAFVAGSIGPLGLTSGQAAEQGIDREDCFRVQMGVLLDGGVDLIILETFQDLDELLIALGVKHSLHHCPAICSLTPNEEGQLPNGMSLGDAFGKLQQAQAEILGINCVNGPQVALRLIRQLTQIEPPVAAFPNAGRPRYSQGRYLYEASPENFAEIGAQIASRGGRIIGGCCGTTPSHIAALAKALAKKKTVSGRERT